MIRHRVSLLGLANRDLIRRNIKSEELTLYLCGANMHMWDRDGAVEEFWMQATV